MSGRRWPGRLQALGPGWPRALVPGADRLRVLGAGWLRVLVPSRLRVLGPDRGAFTAELAAGLPALMLLLLSGLTAVSAVTVQGRCVDAAREGALTAARGGPGIEHATRIAPTDAQITMTAGEDTVTVTVRAPVPILGAHLPAITVRAQAVAAREPDLTAPVP